MCQYQDGVVPKQTIQAMSKSKILQPTIGFKFLAEYGLEDMTVGVSGGCNQSVDEEYQAYIGQTTGQDITILQFWTVHPFHSHPS